MNWLSSPLAATAVVCTILAVLAIPLRKLTAERVALPVPTVEISGNAHGHGHDFHAVLRVRLLDNAQSLHVRTTEGVVLWEAGNLKAGEHEVETNLLLTDDALELILKADFGADSRETALFLTIMPEGVEEITHYALGAGSIEEVLHFEWDLH